MTPVEASTMARKGRAVAKATGWLPEETAQGLNREAWLNRLANRYCWPLIEGAGGERKHNVRISVGFPKGSRGGNKSVAQCWDTKASTDKTFEIFISPVLEVFEAAHSLIHELIHASVGLKCKHRGRFKEVATACGLTGKMTATVPNDELKALILGVWLKEMPPFPHAPMNPNAKNPNKQGTRLIKVKCSDECDYTVRITKKWLMVGPPGCPEHGSMQLIENKEGEE